MRSGVAVFAATLAMGSGTSAQTDAEVEARQTVALTYCIETGDAGRGDRFARLACWFDELGRQDARLNRTYRSTIARLDREKRSRLRELQRDWIGQRDDGCREEAQPERDGPRFPSIELSCQVNKTIRRTLFLERYRG